MRILNYSKGLTFVEILVAVLILGISTVAITGLALLGSRSAMESERQVVALGVANERMEFIRSLTYDMVGYEEALENEPEGALKREYILDRGKQRYQLTTYVETVNDPLTQEEEDYKRVRVQVKWITASGNQRDVTIVTDVAHTPMTCTPFTPSVCPVYASGGGTGGSSLPACSDVCDGDGCPDFIDGMEGPFESLDYIDCPPSGVCPDSGSAAFSTGVVCEEGEEFCLNCSNNSDCASNELCMSGQCQNACDSISCDEGATCNYATGSCVTDCSTDETACGAGESCQNGECQATNNCTFDGCSGGSVCDEDPDSPTSGQCQQICNDGCGCPAGTSCNTEEGVCDPDPTPTPTVSPTMSPSPSVSPTVSPTITPTLPPTSPPVSDPPPPTTVPPTSPPPPTTVPPTSPPPSECVCGDGVCCPEDDENTCSDDCGPITPPPITGDVTSVPPPTSPPPSECVCGDGVCCPEDDDNTCSDDCGPITPPPTTDDPVSPTPPPTDDPVSPPPLTPGPGTITPPPSTDDPVSPTPPTDDPVSPTPIGSPPAGGGGGSPDPTPTPTPTPTLFEVTIVPSPGSPTPSDTGGGGGFCGDGICSSSEDEFTCPEDCGGTGGNGGGGFSPTPNPSDVYCDVNDDGATDCDNNMPKPPGMGCEEAYGCQDSDGNQYPDCECEDPNSPDYNPDDCKPVRNECCAVHDSDDCSGDGASCTGTNAFGEYEGTCEERLLPGGCYAYKCIADETWTPAPSITPSPSPSPTLSPSPSPVPTSQYCGDGICADEDNWQTCSLDCGGPTATVSPTQTSSPTQTNPPTTSYCDSRLCDPRYIILAWYNENNFVMNNILSLNYIHRDI